jgi:hypothetical protein
MFDGHLNDLPASGTCLNRTIGYLTSMNRREIRLVRDVTDADNTVRWPYAIPRRLVRSITYLEPVQPATEH